jgi:hypothetical protein
LAIDRDEAKVLPAGDRHSFEVAINGGHRFPLEAPAEALLLGHCDEVVGSIVGARQESANAG